MAWRDERGLPIQPALDSVRSEGGCSARTRVCGHCVAVSSNSTLDIARQHEQALMSQSFTHAWDEIESFEPALPHARKEPRVAEVEAGCNRRHAPLAFPTGDIPPGRPAEGTRADDGVSCDLCHSITGFEGEVPFDFNYVVTPGDTKFGSRASVEGPGHEIVLLAAGFLGRGVPRRARGGVRTRTDQPAPHAFHPVPFDPKEGSRP